MAIQENVAINFVTSYQGKGLNQAKSQVGSFEALANKAGKTFAGLFATEKIIAFGKASVDAFMGDQKALALLDQTLKDLGLSFDSVAANEFITKLSETYGLTKEQLIPSFQTLIRYTRDFTAAQKLSQLALDISAGTGKDLASVSTALGKAYGGNTTALGRLGTGLTKADLASKNFASIQAKLSNLFQGDAAAAADTYAGKVNRLKVAFHDMQVQIGQGLVDAFTKIAGNGGSIDSATKAMSSFGDTVGNAILGVGVLVRKVEDLYNSLGFLKKIGSFFSNSFVQSVFMPEISAIKTLAKIGKESKGPQTDAQAIALERQAAATAAIDAKKKAIADAQAVRDAAAIKKANADTLALQKAQIALKRDSKTMDLQAIENYAALQQAQSQDDKNRLMLMQALLDQNATAATNLANKVLAANGLVMDLQGNITKDPFAAWAQSLENFNADLEAGLVTAQKLLTLTTGLSAGNPTAGTSINAAGQAGFAADFAASIDYSAAASTANNQPIVINNNYAVNAAGMVGTAADFAAAINYSIVDTSGSGVATSLSRVNSSLLGPKIG